MRGTSLQEEPTTASVVPQPVPLVEQIPRPRQSSAERRVLRALLRVAKLKQQVVQPPDLTPSSVGRQGVGHG